MPLNFFPFPRNRLNILGTKATVLPIPFQAPSPNERLIPLNDLVLHSRDKMKCFPDRTLFEVTQQIRVDEVIRRLTQTDLLILVVDPEQHDEFKCMFKIIGVLLDYRVHAPESRNSLKRRGLADPFLEGKKPEDVD